MQFFNSAGGVAPSYPSGNATYIHGLGAVVGDDGLIVMDDGTVSYGGVIEPNYTATLQQIESVAPGAVAEAKASGWSFDSIMKNLSAIVGTVVQAEAQRDLLKANLKRAEQGLPPLNAQAYMPGVNVGVTSDTQRMVYILGGLAIAALVLPQLMPRGRRR